jgi:hypothetical protein
VTLDDHQGGLGELEGEGAVGQRAALQRRGDRERQSRVVQLTRRHVDRQPQRLADP